MTLPDLPSVEPPPPGEDLRKHYVHRLERLIRLRSDYEEHLNPLGLELIDRAIYATYRDCVDNGAGARAKALMVRLK